VIRRDTKTKLLLLRCNDTTVELISLELVSSPTQPKSHLHNCAHCG